MEADDLIASYARHAQRQGWEVLIASSDKDMAQLVSSHIRLYDPFKQQILDAKALKPYGASLLHVHRISKP